MAVLRRMFHVKQVGGADKLQNAAKDYSVTKELSSAFVKVLCELLNPRSK